LFFLSPPATTAIYALSLHDALPISASRRSHPVHARARARPRPRSRDGGGGVRATERRGIPAGPSGRADAGGGRSGHGRWRGPDRSEEHTSELQSRSDLVCRLLLEKK